MQICAVDQAIQSHQTTLRIVGDRDARASEIYFVYKEKGNVFPAMAHDKSYFHFAALFSDTEIF